MNSRRKLLVVLAACAVTPLTARAQVPAGLKRIGFMAFPSSDSKARLEAFTKGLRELGYVEGRNFVLEYRSAEGRRERYPVIAVELVRSGVDVIVADDGTESALAARNATRAIPIVFPTAGDPVATGIVASLARPGGNITGLSLQSSDLTVKRLELLKEIVPGAKRVAFLMNPGNPNALTELKELQAASRVLGVEVLPAEARTSVELDGAFAEMASRRVEAACIFSDAMFIAEPARIAALATKLKLPTIGGNVVMPNAGALASYGANRPDMLRRAAILVDKILKGANPGDLPIEQPTKFELVINMKTAKVLGITIPQSVLVRADRVIE